MTSPSAQPGRRRTHAGRGRRVARGLFTAALLAGLVAVPASPGVQADPPIPLGQRIADPTYANPTASPATWSQLINSVTATVGISVANIANGPDYQPDPAWAAVIAAAHRAGIKVLGYVDTGYFGATGLPTRLGSRSAADWTSQIELDVNAWYNFYGSGIDGIFFDEGLNACGPTHGSSGWVDLYRGLTAYVKDNHPGALTVDNPGTAVPACYADAADVLVTFEGSYRDYTGTPDPGGLAYQPLSWNPQDPYKIWHLVYGAATKGDLQAAISLSKTRGAGYIYVTDAVPGNPYDRLPPADYWAAEQLQIAPAVAATTPPPVPGNLQLEAVTATTATFGWSVPSPESRSVVAYDIYRDGLRVASVGSGQTSFTAEGLDPARQYHFSVAARDIQGDESARSPALGVTSAGPAPVAPGPPQDFAVTAMDYTSARLRWGPAAPGGAAITGYLIYEYRAPVLTVPASTTSLLIGGLHPQGSPYLFSVQAVDASGGRSRRTDPVRVTTASLPAGNTVDQPRASAAPDGTIVLSASYFIPFSFRRAFIATGNPRNPCWKLSATLCADFIVENSQLYKYAGDGTDFTVTSVGAVTPTVTGYTYRWTIRASDIGSPAAATIEYSGQGYAPLAYSAAVPLSIPAPGPPATQTAAAASIAPGGAPAPLNLLRVGAPPPG